MLKIILYLVLFITINNISHSNTIKKDEFKHGVSRFNNLKYPADFDKFDYTSKFAKKGGILRLVSIGIFNTLNPYKFKGIAPAYINLVYDSLMVESEDESESYYGLIADGIKVADDKKSVTFRIRDIAKWNNGDKITPEDIIFSFKTLLSEAHPIYKVYYKDVLDVIKLEDNLVKFIFKKENDELPILCGSMPIFSKKFYTNNNFKEHNMAIPITSGPYSISKVNQGKYIVYKRNPNYWGKDINVNKYRYNFDKIRVDYYLDNSVAIEALKAGDYDLRVENISKFWNNSYSNLDSVENGLLIKEEIKHEIPLGMQSFLFNLRKKKFQDIRVRKALNHIFNFEWTNSNLFYNNYNRTISFFQNSKFQSELIPQGKELEILKEFKDSLDSKLFTQKFSLPKNNNRRKIRENIQIANNLLNQAGWLVTNGKRIDPNTNEQAEITFLINSKTFSRVISPFIRNLKRLGIKGKIKLLDGSEFQNKIQKFDYDIIIKYFTMNSIPGQEQFNYWHSSQANIEGSKNFAGAENKIIDNLVEKISTSKSIDEIEYLAKALDRVLLWQYYVIPHWYLDKFRIIYWNKFKRPDTIPTYSLGLFNWWSSEN